MEQATVGTPYPLERERAQEDALRNIRALPVLLSIITIALGLIYLAVIPPWGGPDEPRHFEYVALLNLKGGLVGYGDINQGVMDEIIQSMDAVNYWKWGVSLWKRQTPGELPKDFTAIYGEGAHQLHQPPLAYLIYLIPYKLFVDSPIRTQLYAMRLISILLDVVVVLAAYVAGRELFPEDATMALAIPVFVMLLPQHLFLHSIVMNDHLAEAALAWILAIMVRTFRLGLNVPRVLAIVVLLAIGLAAKRTALYAVPILAFAFFVYMFVRWGSGRLSWRQKSIRLALTIIVLGLAAIGLVYGWRWVAVHQPSVTNYIVHLFLFLPSAQFPFQADARLIEPAMLKSYADNLKQTFISTWGHFGWMNITLGVQVYWGFAALSVASLIGLAVYALRDLKKLLPYQRAVLVVFAVSALVPVAAIIALQARFIDLGWDAGAEGRYIFPVLIAFATLFLLGLRAFFPRTRYMLWFGLMTGAMVFYNIVVLVFYIVPFYRA